MQPLSANASTPYGQFYSTLVNAGALYKLCQPAKQIIDRETDMSQIEQSVINPSESDVNTTIQQSSTPGESINNRAKRALVVSVLAASLLAPMANAHALPIFLPLLFLGKGTVAAKGTAVAVTTAKAATVKATTAKAIAAKAATAKAAAAKTTTAKAAGVKAGASKSSGNKALQQLQADIRAREAEERMQALRGEIVGTGLDIVEISINNSHSEDDTRSGQKKK